MSSADYQLTASDRMQLASVIGRDGVRALDAMLARLRAGEKPHKPDLLDFCRALHENDVIDFSDWPEFRKRRNCGAGHPNSGLMSALRPRG